MYWQPICLMKKGNLSPNNMNTWHKIFTTSNMAEASIIQGLLEQNQIPVQQLNKLDSSYLNFGDIEIYVPVHLKDTAAQLVQQSLLN
jgi:Putative prokaryotic signal transducing protein